MSGFRRGVWPCCVRGLGGLCCGGDLRFCSVFHIVLLAVSHKPLPFLVCMEE